MTAMLVYVGICIAKPAASGVKCTRLILLQEYQMNFRQFFTSQPWWGKIIGSTMGYLMAGPIGALFGIMIGNFFDRGLHSHFSRPYWPYQIEKDALVKQTFCDITFSIMGHIAKSDGRVSKEEISQANILMGELQLTGAEKDSAQRCFNDGKRVDFDWLQQLSTLRNITRGRPALLKTFVDIEYHFAQLDGLSADKLQLFNKILQNLGLAPLQQQHNFYDDFTFHRTYQQHHHSRGHDYNNDYVNKGPTYNSLSGAFKVLGVSTDANKQEVKRAYRRLMSRYHPDKSVAKGLSKEAIKTANEKTQKICKAYEEICKMKGW